MNTKALILIGLAVSLAAGAVLLMVGPVRDSMGLLGRWEGLAVGRFTSATNYVGMDGAARPTVLSDDLDYYISCTFSRAGLGKMHAVLEIRQVDADAGPFGPEVVSVEAAGDSVSCTYFHRFALLDEGPLLENAAELALVLRDGDLVGRGEVRQLVLDDRGSPEIVTDPSGASAAAGATFVFQEIRLRRSIEASRTSDEPA